jgi:hypothetical protein
LIVQIHQPPLIASLSWDPTCASLETVRINDSRYRHSGLASILGNIFLRSLKANKVPLAEACAISPLAYAASDLNVVGWLAKFGLSSFRSKDLQRFFDEFPALSVMVETVENSRPARYYFQLVDRRGSPEPFRAYKVFLYQGGADLFLHQSLANNKDQLAALIREQKAFVNLHLYMDPRKAVRLEHYAAALPPNPFE